MTSNKFDYLRSGLILASLLTIAGISTSAQAQTLILNFQASTYTTGDANWIDSVNGVEAGAGGTPIGDGPYIDTTNGSFIFNTGDVPGLVGITSYTLVVGFRANSVGTNGGGNYVNSNGGVAGVLIGATYNGGNGFGLTTDSNGQLIAGLGSYGGDQNLYDSNPSTGGTFTTGTNTGAVLVVDGLTNTASFYVDGSLTTQPGIDSGFPVAPFGYNGNYFTTYPSPYGIGNIAYVGGTLQGYINQFQIYDGAVSPTEAEALSLPIPLPEPSTWALLLGGLGSLVFYRLRTHRA